MGRPLFFAHSAAITGRASHIPRNALTANKIQYAAFCSVKGGILEAER